MATTRRGNALPIYRRFARFSFLADHFASFQRNATNIEWRRGRFAGVDRCGSEITSSHRRAIMSINGDCTDLGLAAVVLWARFPGVLTRSQATKITDD